MATNDEVGPTRNTIRVIPMADSNAVTTSIVQPRRCIDHSQRMTSNQVSTRLRQFQRELSSSDSNIMMSTMTPTLEEEDGKKLRRIVDRGEQMDAHPYYENATSLDEHPDYQNATTSTNNLWVVDNPRHADSPTKSIAAPTLATKITRSEFVNAVRDNYKESRGEVSGSKTDQQCKEVHGMQVPLVDILQVPTLDTKETSDSKTSSPTTKSFVIGNPEACNDRQMYASINKRIASFPKDWSGDLPSIQSMALGGFYYNGESKGDKDVRSYHTIKCYCCDLGLTLICNRFICWIAEHEMYNEELEDECAYINSLFHDSANCRECIHRYDAVTNSHAAMDEPTFLRAQLVAGERGLEKKAELVKEEISKQIKKKLTQVDKDFKLAETVMDNENEKAVKYYQLTKTVGAFIDTSKC